jgi:hypothetical protein
MLGMAIIGIFFFIFLHFRGTPANQFIQNATGQRTINPSQAGIKSKKKAGVEPRPFMEIQKVVPFGRSLEVIGRVETGAKLSVNDENVEISGDGSFKHFTKLFPASSGKVRLELKATDLAGRTRILTAFHDFSSSGESN